MKLDIEELFITLSNFTQEGASFIFRGSSEAKYKLYNSAQRFFIDQELYKQVPNSQISEYYKKFVKNLIENCKTWNNGVVSKLLKSSGIDENNDLAYLSFLQHYGIPTPFLDYSYNPYVSLFHAIDKITDYPNNNEIDDYFSLYCTYDDETMLQLFKHVFDENINKKDMTYETMASNEMSIISSKDEVYKIVNSVNIINQEGLFLFNNHPFYPFEIAYKELYDNLKIEKGQARLDEITAHPMASACFNIHKSLIPIIRKKLKELGINQKFIFPNIADLKNHLHKESVNGLP